MPPVRVRACVSEFSWHWMSLKERKGESKSVGVEVGLLSFQCV